MRLSQRTNALLIVAVAVCAAGARATTIAEQRTKAAGDAKSRAAARQRRERQTAVAAVREAAEAARAEEDAYEKVRLLSDAADALWPFDEPAARALLREAWETTTAPGAEAAFNPEDDERFDAADLMEAAREVVVSRAARHDQRLSEGYMREAQALSAARADRHEDAEAPAGPHDVWRRPSASALQRLSVAHSLLNEGDHKTAAAVAAPVIAEGPTRPLLNFIAQLRRFDAGAADALYLRLLERARADATTDANDVLLLSAPIISPELRASIAADGSVYFSPVYTEGPREEQPPVPRRARLAFFDAAAALLARPALPRPGAHGGAGEAFAAYFAIGRLLPFFDREAPRHSAMLRARIAALSQEIGEGRRASASSQMSTLSLTPKGTGDPLQGALERLAQGGGEELDRLRFEVVWQAARLRIWERARRMADEIVSADVRRSALLVIKSYQVLGAYEAFEDEEQDDDFGHAAAFVREADVKPAVRAYGYARASELAARKGKRARAAELFGEALSAAAQAKGRAGESAELLTALVASATRAASDRTWELLGELAAALDDRLVSEPAGGDCHGFGVAAPDGSCYRVAPEGDLPPEEVFALAARLDLARTLEAARRLKDNATRAAVLLAAARTALGKDGAKGAGGR